MCFFFFFSWRGSVSIHFNIHPGYRVFFLFYDETNTIVVKTFYRFQETSLFEFVKYSNTFTLPVRVEYVYETYSKNIMYTRHAHITLSIARLARDNMCDIVHYCFVFFRVNSAEYYVRGGNRWDYENARNAIRIIRYDKNNMRARQHDHHMDREQNVSHYFMGTRSQRFATLSGTRTVY